jgi:hypothetical protein
MSGSYRAISSKWPFPHDFVRAEHHLAAELVMTAITAIRWLSQVAGELTFWISLLARNWNCE